jgi:hypothetical protein
LSLPFINKAVRISWPELVFSFEDTGEELPIQQQILILHYLRGTLRSQGAAVTGEWIAFQEVPDGKFYLDAFHRRARNPLVQTFGNDPEKLIELAAGAFGAIPSDQGDLSVVIKAFPLVPIVLMIWKGDDEFPPEGNILFDKNIPGILSAEDIAWLSGMVIYPLIGMV